MTNDEQPKAVCWEGVDGNHNNGYQFPCGKKYNADYYTRSEAINYHIPECKECRDNVLASIGGDRLNQ